MSDAKTMEETLELGAQRDSHWRALTLETLSEEEAAALQQESLELYERCRPFDTEELARILARVEARLSATMPTLISRRSMLGVWASLIVVAIVAGMLANVAPTGDHRVLEHRGLFRGPGAGRVERPCFDDTP